MQPKVRSELFWQIGKRVRIARLRRRLSTRQLAERVNVTRNTIQKYELGLNNIPLPKALIICDVLRISPLYLFSLETRPLDISGASNHALKLAMKLEKLPNPVRILLYNLINEICKTYEGAGDEKSNGEPSRIVGALAGRISDRTLDRSDRS